MNYSMVKSLILKDWYFQRKSNSALVCRRRGYSGHYCLRR